MYFQRSAETLETEFGKANSDLTCVCSKLKASRAECRAKRSCISDLELQVKLIFADTSALSLATAFDNVAFDSALRLCTSVACECHTLSCVMSDQPAAAARQEDHLGSVACAIRELNLCKVPCSTHTHADNLRDCELVFNFDVSSRLFPYVGSIIK